MTTDARMLAAAACAVAALMVVAQPARATIVDDTTLTDPPGVFFGTGNVNADWTVDNESDGIQLGLQGLERFVAPYTPVAGTSTYDAAVGATTVPTKTGSAWDIAFSVNTGSALTLPTTAPNGITTALCLTDVGLGTNGCFDVLGIPDNSVESSPGVYDVAQNAEALSFSAIAALLGDPGYNINANDTYDFTLTLLNADVAIAEVGATVVVGSGAAVPEPTSLSLLGAGLLALGVLRRRKRNNSR